ncbi:hypothetical protein SADUNF_Sadunf02G0200500 [Salix dunnii]|uniref:Uncharacterized protein n=1 Tax=Salix dunnii TaxID=1413687 RepID=A0A835TIC1_9ROSI|nr:hypothetical protein SADUNF_Sadunf02G0200500 [Salix dunnii]
MERNCCHVSVAFVLKLLNFLQAFVGISIIIYSFWMLDQWNHKIPVFPPSAPSPDSSFASSSLLLLPGSESHSTRDLVFSDVAPRFENGLDFDLNSFQLPAPWFIYSFMGVGIILCCITFIGCIAAESINGCCLCFYTILKIALILLEAALVAFIAIDHRWEKDLPFDPTRELQSLRIFIEENIDICKWAGITVLIIQTIEIYLCFAKFIAIGPSMFLSFQSEMPFASHTEKMKSLNASMTTSGDQSSTCSLKPKGQANGLQQLLELGDPKNDPWAWNIDDSQWPFLILSLVFFQALALLLAMILRAMISTRRNEFDEDDFEHVRGRTREPLLNQAGQTFSPGTHVDIWTSRMREKYGLSTGDKPNLNQNASMSMKSKSLEARVHGRFVLIGENILRKNPECAVFASVW